MELGMEFNNSLALSIAPFIPLAASVSSIWAPKKANIFLRSKDILSGIVNINLYPFDAATNARATPVFPEVGSMIVTPGFK